MPTGRAESPCLYNPLTYNILHKTKILAIFQPETDFADFHRKDLLVKM